MKNCYAVKKINLAHINTVTDYWNAVNAASVHYCNGLDELRDFCGGHLRRERHGYAGRNGNIEYVAVRVR